MFLATASAIKTAVFPVSVYLNCIAAATLLIFINFAVPWKETPDIAAALE